MSASNENNLSSYKAHTLVMQAFPELTGAQLNWFKIAYEILDYQTTLFNLVFKKNFLNLTDPHCKIKKEEIRDQILKDYLAIKLFFHSFPTMVLGIALYKLVMDSFQYLSYFEPINLMIVSLVGITFLSFLIKTCHDYLKASHKINTIYNNSEDFSKLFR